MSGEGFVHSVDVRYGECDAQGVVFNANFLVYVDDAMDHWVRSGPDVGWTEDWDVMLKRAEVEWSAPVRWPSVVEIRPAVTRWGSTSFDVRFELDVDSGQGPDRVAVVDITYVSIDSSTGSTMITPDLVRSVLGGNRAGGR